MTQISCRYLMLNLLALLFLFPAWSAHAHEVRPALLEIRQSHSGPMEITWKRPVQGEMALHLKPQLSNGWLETSPAEQHQSDSFLTQKWSIEAVTEQPLTGSTLTIEGLTSSITDVLVRVHWASGEQQEFVLSPDRASITLEGLTESPVALPAMFLLGGQHILAGVDHLLFVLGMLLLVRSRSLLVKTITSFTIAHSMTLCAVALGHFSVPVPFVEAMITLSIVFLAAEVVRMQRGATSISIRFPWLVAFGFGLFHGLGFATAFSGIQADTGELVSALLLFNLGVEAGQLLFIVAVLVIAWLVRANQWPAFMARRVPAYAMGIAGAYWSILNTATLFAVH